MTQQIFGERDSLQDFLEREHHIQSTIGGGTDDDRLALAQELVDELGMSEEDALHNVLTTRVDQQRPFRAPSSGNNPQTDL
jgi:hypothetical protein